jgi:hypothetical protein
VLCWVLFKFLLQDQAEESLDLEDSLMLYEETPEATPYRDPSPRTTSIGRGKRKAPQDMTAYQAQILQRIDQTKYTETQHYLLSLAPAIDRLDPRKQALAKLRIQQALYDIEFGE